MRPSRGQLGFANPSKMVLRKMEQSRFLEKLGHENLFMSVNEAIKSYKLIRVSSKSANNGYTDNGSDGYHEDSQEV